VSTVDNPLGLDPWQIADQAWQLRARAYSAQLERQRLAEKVARGVERTSAPRVPLTMDALIDAIGKRVDGGCGWDLLKRQLYAEHLVQPWCSCEVGDGWRAKPGRWELCQHAKDEGF
jgi:hypothetical protein